MGSRCSEKVDIFSLGVVLWELVTGKHICMHSDTFGSFVCVKQQTIAEVALLGPLQARAQHGDASDLSSALWSLAAIKHNCNTHNAKHKCNLLDRAPSLASRPRAGCHRSAARRWRTS